MAKLHRKLPLPLRRRPQLGTKPKHTIQAAIRIKRKILRPNLRLTNHRIPLIQQPHNITLELIRRGNRGLHQRFQDLGFPRRERFAEGLLRSGLERHFRRIGHVRCAVVDDHLRTQDFVPDKGPLEAGGLEAFVACVEELFADGSAGDLLFEFIGFEAAGGFHPAHDAGEVARAAGLLFEEVVEGNALGDGFAVGDLGLAGFAGDAVFAAHALDVDVEVEFTHSGDDGFRGFGVDVDAEGGVFALEAGHGF